MNKVITYAVKDSNGKAAIDPIRLSETFRQLFPGKYVYQQDTSEVCDVFFAISASLVVPSNKQSKTPIKA